MPGHLSAAVGLWFGLGSRHDPPEREGLAHLFEHMIFKGTARRSPTRVLRELEDRGGSLNAFTTREQTCVVARILAPDLARAVDLVTDLCVAPRLSERDLDKERQVVVEEIRGADDDPEERVADLFPEGLWTGDPLSHPIAGTTESVSSASRDDLIRYADRLVSGPVPVCLAVAGAVEHDRLTELAMSRLGHLASRPIRQCEAAPGRRHRARLVEHREVSQVNLVLARRIPGADHAHRDDLLLLQLLLGGGMASRFNMALREKRGLCYGVYTFVETLVGAGAMGISLSAEPSQARRAVEQLAREIERLREKGVSKRELDAVRSYARGITVMGLEGPGSRMQLQGRSMLVHGRPESLEHLLEGMDAVDLSRLHRAVDLHLKPLTARDRWTLAAVGPHGEDLADLLTA